MGILTKAINRWQTMTTEEKAGKVLDIICGWGLGTVCGAMGSTFSAGKGKPTRICAAVGMAGIGMIAGDAAGKALTENLAKPCIELGREIRKKAKEEKSNDEHPYTRY